MKHTDYAQGHNVRYNYQIQEGGITIRLCIQEGHVVLYASLTVPNPNRALNDFVLDAVFDGNECKDVFVDPDVMVDSISDKERLGKRQTPPERNLFVSIEGISNSSTFTLNTTMGDTAQSKKNYQLLFAVRFSFTIFDNTYTHTHTDKVTCTQDVCGSNTNCTDDPIGYSCECLPGYVFEADLKDCEGTMLIMVVFK